MFLSHHPIRQAGVLEPGYFRMELRRNGTWLGEKIVLQMAHSDLTEPRATAGITIERICEPTPCEALKGTDPNGCDRLRRVLAFLLIRAQKLTA